MGIEDKGKSGWIAKYLVLLQTSWFVKQCIAWGVEHLPVAGTNHSTPISLFECSGNLSRGPEDVEQISNARGLEWKAIHKGLEIFIAGFQGMDVNLSREESARGL